jgi:hypothetical protein
MSNQVYVVVKRMNTKNGINCENVMASTDKQIAQSYAESQLMQHINVRHWLNIYHFALHQFANENPCPSVKHSSTISISGEVSFSSIGAVSFKDRRMSISLNEVCPLRRFSDWKESQHQFAMSKLINEGLADDEVINSMADDNWRKNNYIRCEFVVQALDLS